MINIQHKKDCPWMTSDCEYKETHYYCPHEEHLCSCAEELTPLRKKISQLLIKYNMPTQQLLISELLALFEEECHEKVLEEQKSGYKEMQDAIASERKRIRLGIRAMIIPKPKCYCRQYSFGEHECGQTSNKAIIDALKIVRGEDI